jgi:membrane protein required for colicin V production
MDAHQGLNNLDYIVVAIVVISGFLAMMRGLVRELFSLLAWFGAYFMAAKYYPLAKPWVHHYVKSDQGATYAAMGVIFFIALIILMIIGSVISGFIKGKALTAVDRSLGFLFGLARGVLIVCLVYLVSVKMFWPELEKTDQPQQVQQAKLKETGKEDEAQQDTDRNIPPVWLTDAKTRPALALGASMLKEFIPDDMFDKHKKEFDEQRAAAQKMIEQKQLEMLSNPTVGGAKEQSPSTDAVNHINPSQLENQKDKP